MPVNPADAVVGDKSFGELLMRNVILVGAILMAVIGDVTAADDASLGNELFPTGKLRVAVGGGPAASALWAVRDGAPGKPRGVTVTLGTAMAEKLNVPVDLV